MKKTVCMLLMFVALLSGCGNVLTDMKTANAGVVVFHQQLNDQKLDVICSSADPNMFQTSSKVDTIRFLTVVHTKLGNVISSKNRNCYVQTFNAETRTTLKQDTKFEKGEATETFVFRIKDQKAYLFSYNIDSRDLIMMNNTGDAKTLVHNNYGHADVSSGGMESEITEYKEAVRLNPNCVIAHNNLGFAYAHSGQYQLAISEYQEAIRLNPNYEPAHNNLGATYGTLGQYQASVMECNEAIRLDPNNAIPHMHLGYAYANLGQYQSAISEYKEAIRLKPDYAKAHYGLGLTYLQNQDKGSALEEYGILQKFDPQLAQDLYNKVYSSKK